jgi:hypothetical protein
MKKQRKSAASNKSKGSSQGQSDRTTTLLESLYSAVTGGDADSLLKADHRKVERLFSKYEALDDDEIEDKADLVQKICKELIVHTMLEEQLFYPACRDHGVDDELLDEAQVEHDTAKIMINELLNEDPEGPYYDAKVKVLSEYIKKHVGEEEAADGTFAKARDAGLDMTALGKEIRERKQELMSMIDERGLPQPKLRALMSERFGPMRRRGGEREERYRAGRMGA